MLITFSDLLIALPLNSTLTDRYLIQAVQSKKKNLIECVNKENATVQSFYAHFVISPDGAVIAKLINSDQKNKEVLKCSIDILNTLRLKSFSGPSIEKSFYFTL